MSSNWPVAHHEPLAFIADELWCIHAELPRIPIGRRMTIARHRDGTLTVHSVICCDEPTMRAIDALGKVARIIVPNAFHRMDAPYWKARYPSARVLAPNPAREAVAKIVTVDGAVDELADDPRFASINLDGLAGEAAFVHTDDRGAKTLVFNDLVQNHPDHIRAPRGWIPRLLGQTGGPKVTPIIKTFLVKDNAACASHLRRLAKLPGLVRIIVSHGAIIENAPTSTASATLIRVAERLSPSSR